MAKFGDTTAYETLAGYDVEPDDTRGVWDASAGKFKLRRVGFDRPSPLDWIPSTLHTAILNGTSTTAVTEYLDDMNTWLAQNESGSVGGGVAYFPKGRFCVDGQITLPVSTFKTSVTWIGAGRQSTEIRLLSELDSGEAVITREALANSPIGGGIRDMLVDARGLADYAIYIPTGKGFSCQRSTFSNAKVTEGLFGHPSTARFYEADMYAAWFRTENGLSLTPDYNLHLQGFATDSELVGVHCNGAVTAPCYIEPGGNALIGCHFYPSTDNPTYDYALVCDGRLRVIGCYMDSGWTTAAVHVNSSGVICIGNKLWWGTGDAAASGPGFLVATGLEEIEILANEYLDHASDELVSFAGTAPSQSQVFDSMLQSTGASLSLAPHGSNIAQLGSNRIRVAGTDFDTSSAALGRWSANNQPPFLSFRKSRGATVGTAGVVQSGDILGALSFSGDDGDSQSEAAQIRVSVDGTPGDADMPGRITFHTSPDGSATVAEWLRIKSTGEISHRQNGTVIVDPNSHLSLRSYTVAGLPSAATAGQLIYVSNESGGAVVAFSDGTNWRRVTDRNIVS